MKRIRLPYNWKPRPYQRNLWSYFEDGGKRAIEIAHRRWGKDDVALHLACTSAFKKAATYWHMLPEYSQARKAIWNAINPHTGKRRIDEAFPLEIRANTNDHEMFIRFINGATWQVVGSDSYNSLVGTPPYGLVISEWALADPAAWAYLAPILEENGGWACFITTSRGRNHAYDMYNMARRNLAWFAELQTVDDTNVIPQERIDSIRKEYYSVFGKEAGEALIEQEYYCSFAAAVLGAVYARWIDEAEKAGRITENIYDPELTVHTAWDLGFDDSTAIWWWQVCRGEVRLIDYYESNGKDVQEYCEIVYGRKINVEQKDIRTDAVVKWDFGELIPEHAHRAEYNYGNHYSPHDGARKLLEAKGRSTVQQAYELGIKMKVVSSTDQVNSIQATRLMLENAYFDCERCVKGLESLRHYHYQYDEDKKTFKAKPRHDGSSHGCDAAEIIALVWRNPESEVPKPKPKFLADMTANDVFWPEKTGITLRERI